MRSVRLSQLNKFQAHVFSGPHYVYPYLKIRSDEVAFRTFRAEKYYLIVRSLGHRPCDSGCDSHISIEGLNLSIFHKLIKSIR